MQCVREHVIYVDTCSIPWRIWGELICTTPSSDLLNKQFSLTWTASRSLHGPGQSTLDVKGYFTGELEKDDIKVKQDIYVVHGLQTALLGRPAIEVLQLLARINAVTAKESYKTAYPNLFEGLGTLPGEYRIELQPDTQPFALNTARRVPLPLRPAVKEELNRMQQLGVISPVDSPTDWCAGMVVVPKPGGKVRICVDLTKLNESVKREKHPLPTVEQTLSQISGAKVFSKLDANAGFWQIPLAEESKQLTTFITPNGRFCFNRLPFGISSAPEHYQKRMSSLLEGLPGVVCQMDDVLIYGPDQETHDRRVHTALQKLAAAGRHTQPCQMSVLSNQSSVSLGRWSVLRVSRQIQ